jgi:hypothetical protein
MLGHLSFNLLCRLSGLGLLRGLPLLKFESDLVCATCRHGKMIAAFHSMVNIVMTRFKTFLLEHGYVMGSVDKTFFTLKHDTDFIFGGSSHTLVSRF